MDTLRVLVAEDEKHMNQMICDYFRSLDWEPLEAFDGKQAWDLFQQKEPHVLVLDLMMPKIDGIDLTRRIREKSQVPILMVTARAEEGDRLLGLEIGADDYITKPFSLKELAARIRVILRRVEHQLSPSSILKHGALEMDLDKRVLKKQGRQVELTAAQFDMLHLMMTSPGRVFKRLELLGAFQEDPWEGYERSIDVHIKNIRKRIEDDPTSPVYIETVWGVGYRFQEVPL